MAIYTCTERSMKLKLCTRPLEHKHKDATQGVTHGLVMLHRIIASNNRSDPAVAFVSHGKSLQTAANCANHGIKQFARCWGQCVHATLTAPFSSSLCNCFFNTIKTLLGEHHQVYAEEIQPAMLAATHPAPLSATAAPHRANLRRPLRRIH